MKRIICRLAAAVLALTTLTLSASALSVDEALELLDVYYLRDIPAQAYQAEDLDELFSVLGDPYTYYMTGEQYQSFLTAVDGSADVVGIGVAIQYTSQGILVTEVLKGGGALDAGVLPGDLIVAVDGVSCVPAGEAHRDLMVGEEGTSVTITVLRDGETRDCTITRRLIHIPNTEFDLLDGHIGYVTCASFGEDTGSLFTEYLTQHDSQTDCWIVDLRGNSGGYTTSAVEAAGGFAGPGNYLYLREHNGGVSYYFYTAADLTDHPAIVLLNANSASASEALAADIRDTGTGISVGTRSYGKGVAQIVCDGSTHSGYFDTDALKITAYRFYSTMGNTTDQVGVIPTLLVPDEYAQEIALALCAPSGGAAEGRLRLELAGQTFTLMPDQVSPEALSALFSALPPTARLQLGSGWAEWTDATPAQAAQQWNVSYTSRWFSDVGASPYADEINTLGVYSLIKGTGGKNFTPQKQLTRAQACVMLARVLNLSYSGAQRFSDVPDGVWYSDGINAMAELGLVKGVGGGRFRPDGPLTQQEFFTILGRVARFLNFAIDSYAQEETDSGVLSQLPELASFASWARPSVAALAWGPQIALGREDASMLHLELDALTPSAPVLREEAAACICRMLWATGILST